LRPEQAAVGPAARCYEQGSTGKVSRIQSHGNNTPAALMPVTNVSRQQLNISRPLRQKTAHHHPVIQ